VQKYHVGGWGEGLELGAGADDPEGALCVDMAEGFDDDAVFIEEDGVGVFAGKLKLEGDLLVFVVAFGGEDQPEDAVAIDDMGVKDAGVGYESMQQGIKRGAVSLQRSQRRGGIDHAVPTGHVEKKA